ncbi:MAG: TIGR00159 family protein, partial [Nitrospirae bacterium]
HPTSPIHDGAVVIRGDRVVAAGCFLPISLRSDLSKNLGTRHRAAIGLTEESDAIVIVVSEETGLISVAEAGRLETPMDMGALMDYLTEAFAQKKKKWEAS